MMLKLFVRNIKKGFATNSSSYHSTIIFTEEEFKKWKCGGKIENVELSYDMIDNDNLEGWERFHEIAVEQREINGIKIVAFTYEETNG